MKNNFNYKWSKLFASKRFKTKRGTIKLTPEEQQEILDNAEETVNKSYDKGFEEGMKAANGI